MDTITLEQLQDLFAELRAETPWDVDGEMLWGYFFISSDPEKLARAGEVLTQDGYQQVGIFQSEDEPAHVLHVERVEKHTPESLFARNQQFEALARELGLDAYDGMDVNPVGGMEEDLEFSDDQLLEEKIENPSLVAAIDDLVDDPCGETGDALDRELQRAVYLVPIFDGAADSEESAAGEEDESVQLLVCTNDEGAEFLPLFTDAESIQAWTSEPVSAMALEASEAWEFILSQKECSGAVVNPGGISLPLDRKQVEEFKQAADKKAEEES